MKFKMSIALVILAGTIFIFQNCSDVRLLPGSKETIASSVASVTSLTATVCPLVEPQTPKNTKFIFVLDMSLSNIGGKAPNTGYFTSSLGSDVDGDRFTLVKNFMSTCAGALGNQFAVVAFSNGAGRIRTVNGQLSFSCDGAFTSSALASSDVDQLMALQNQDKIFWAGYEGKPYFGGYSGIMWNTSYSQAMNCVTNLVVNDLAGVNGASSSENYEVIFLSDGQPKDATAGDVRFKDLYDVGCESKGYAVGSPEYEACYLNGIDGPLSYAMEATLGLNKNMRVHAIYYKSPTNTAPDFTATIEKYMGEIARVGGTFEATILGLLRDELGTGENPLCKLTEIQSSTEFRPDVMTIVNLTMKRVNGALVADSDMDGLSDDEEVQLGSNPTKARSQVNGVLDGVCMKVGGFAACQTKRNAITCSGTPNALGISECDLKLLKINDLYNHPDPGIDTDKDGMPDIVEILRGTDPGVKDMLGDPDGDGRTNKREILENTAPMVFDSLADSTERPEYSVQYLNREAATTCSYGAWQLHASTLPGVDTQAFVNAQPTSLIHDAHDNVYLVFYRQDPVNANDNVRFYGAIVHSRYIRDTSAIKVILDREEILPANFTKLGEVLP